MASSPTGFDELLVQLRMTNSLLVMNLQQDGGFTQKDLILMLARTDAPSGEIAKILGTTPNTVQVAISKDKASRRSGKAASKKKLLPEKPRD